MQTWLITGCSSGSGRELALAVKRVAGKRVSRLAECPARAPRQAFRLGPRTVGAVGVWR